MIQSCIQSSESGGGIDTSQKAVKIWSAKWYYSAKYGRNIEETPNPSMAENVRNALRKKWPLTWGLINRNSGKQKGANGFLAETIWMTKAPKLWKWWGWGSKVLPYSGAQRMSISAKGQIPWSLLIYNQLWDKALVLFAGSYNAWERNILLISFSQVGKRLCTVKSPLLEVLNLMLDYSFLLCLKRHQLRTGLTPIRASFFLVIWQAVFCTAISPGFEGLSLYVFRRD